MRERGKNGLQLAVRLVVRTKVWLAACLGGQVAGWSASCVLIACLRSAVSHLMYASGTQKERVRERERERERENNDNYVGCPYGWLTGWGDDLVLPAWLGRLAPPLRACLHSLLLESGP